LFDISGIPKFHILNEAKSEFLKMSRFENETFTRLQLHNAPKIPKASKRKTKKGRRKRPGIAVTTITDPVQLPEINRLEQQEILDLINLETNPDNDQITNEIPNNPQNTHDHSVVQTVTKSISNLLRVTPMNQDVSTSLIDIRNRIKSHSKISDQQKKYALMTLDRIEKNDEYMSNTGMKESEILNLVWNRLHTQDIREQGNQEQGIENLIKELCESVEHDQVMCSTGRVNRIVDSLNIIDPLVEIKPVWALNQEMMTKAAKIRQEMETKLNESQKLALESRDPTKDEQLFIEDFDKTFKNTLRRTFERDYVQTGVMQKSILDLELDKWIDDI
jgi:hypothetical protein